MCAGAKCAYLRTIAADFQPSLSCRSYNGVPFWISQLAQVCRKSCQRKSAIPARLRALRQAFVFTYLTGLPSYVKTRSGCFPRWRSNTSSAKSHNEMWMSSPPFASSAAIQAVRRLR